MPKVSIVVPVLNGEKYIAKALDSILNQTFTDWELIAVVEFGSNKESVAILNNYAKHDNRIKILQNDENLGISKSLNRGIDAAIGEYIARMDADDIAFPQRLERQVAYMDKNLDVGVLGTDFEVIGANWKSNLVLGRKNIKAELLFNVCLRHPTVMYRKSVLDEHSIRYSLEYAASEDYEIFSRLIEVTVIENLPEKLVTYRRHPEAAVNRNLYKGAEVCRIVGKRLLKKLDMELSDDDMAILYNHCLLDWDRTNYHQGIVETFSRLEEILLSIEKKNKRVNVYNSKSLKIALKKRFSRAEEMAEKRATAFEKKMIQKIYKKSRYGRRIKNIKGNLRRLCGCIKKVLKWFFRPLAILLRKFVKAAFKNCLKDIDKSVERWTWERYLRQFVNGIGNNNNYSYVKYYSGTKIRVLFVVQSTAFWVSQEQVYKSLLNDNRFEVLIVCYDAPVDRTIKTNTTRGYLENDGYNFVPWENFIIEDYNPHIVFLQTPYDSQRRNGYKSIDLKYKGYRIIYISYGVEITDTESSRSDQFRNWVVPNLWKIYTLSETLRNEYLRYANINADVVASGMPRFDALYHKENFPQLQNVVKRAGKRKIVLWKVHFPKVIREQRATVFVTPDLAEYISFAKILKNYSSDLFFVFMPHPRFKEFNEDEIVQKQLKELMGMLSNQENVFIDDNDDYRNSLLNADCIIVDRSAVMVEAAVSGVPVLFMSNEHFHEELSKAVKPLIDSYYQGTTCKDMVDFVEQFRRGEDPKKSQREEAFKQCIPYFDGKCGERIKEDIVASLQKEQNQSIDSQFEALNERLEKLEQKLLQKADVVASMDSDVLPKIDKSIERWTWNRYQRSQRDAEEIHNHIDLTYHDVMVVLEKQLQFVGKHDIVLQTEYPVAYKSMDHIHPRGTANDTTCYPRFIKKCETVLKKDRGLSFLDLGCSAGGMVLDAIIRGHFGIGLEGSDYSLVRQRAEWRLLRENLFTCDITKPFTLFDKDAQKPKLFDVITMWEVLEHIAEQDLPQLFENIKKHLSNDGIFVGSICCMDDIDSETGINWHTTVQPIEWWRNKFGEFGFEELEGLFDKEDMARGYCNHHLNYQTLSVEKFLSEFVVLRKKR